MKRFINDFFRFGFVGICIGLGFFITAFVFIKAASLTATSGSPLTATNWNDMISNFFWGSGSGGIYYNGKVGIGTNAPNRNLHVYDTSANAEIDLQSVSGAGKHWGIYQDATTQELRMRNGVDRVKVSTGGNLNAQGLCINGDCKTAWSQVGGGVAGNLNSYTGTCDSSHRGYGGVIGGVFKLCNGKGWIDISVFDSYFDGDGTASNPYRPLGYSASGNVPATSCNYYNLNATTSNTGTSRGSGICGGGSKGCLSNGVYRINPSGSSSYNVYCDMVIDGGGRTWIQQGVGSSIASEGTIQTDWANYAAAVWKLSDADINSLRNSTWEVMFSDYENSTERPYRQFVKMTSAYNYSIGALTTYQRKNGTSGRTAVSKAWNRMLTDGNTCYNTSTGVWSNPSDNLHIYYSDGKSYFRCVQASPTSYIRIMVR